MNPSELSDKLTNDQKKVVKSFNNRLTITPLRKTKLVEISYLSSDADLASEVANTVARQYIASYIEGRVNRTSDVTEVLSCLLYTSPSPRDLSTSRMPSSA